MVKKSRVSEPAPSVLATDLDGTLIPLDEHEANRTALRHIEQSVVTHEITLAFVTGRHLESVQRAISEHALPRPQWIICDVGTTIYEQQPDGEFVALSDYHDHLESICSTETFLAMREELADIPSLKLQEEEKQGLFKQSYYVPQSELRDVISQIEQRLHRTDASCSLISSVDPFTGGGLIDLLPQGVSKAYALRWWGEHRAFTETDIVFAGDSGNDLAALVAGYRAILVNNADPTLAKQVTDEHQRQEWTDRLYLAEEPATSGVLSGCRWFGLFPSKPASDPTLTSDAT